jgi:chromosome segregation ATPase
MNKSDTFNLGGGGSVILPGTMGGHEEEHHEGAANYKKAVVELDETIKDLDVKLNRVLAKQEYEYLKGYNVYVKQKEKELKDTINQLSERYNNQGAKDKKLTTLQNAIKTIREEQIKMDHDNVGLKDRVKKLRALNEELVSERDFYQAKAKEVKKKNQLLKLAILRLQNEVDSLKKAGEERRAEDYE